MKPWFDRTFTHDLPVGLAPDLFARLRQNIDRLDEAVRGLPRPVLVHRPEGRWSIQEHAGHLLDLEPLWDQRLDDFDRGSEVLQAADLENRKTHEAGHNGRPIAELITAFRHARTTILARLDKMSAPELARVALHPRLQRRMSVVDLCFFVAEHDDHHLKTIAELTADVGAMPIYAVELMNTVETAVRRLLDADDERAALRLGPGKWSPKEIVGHLIDSASNNHQRFVRAMFQDDLVFAGYMQDEWVALQRYQDAPWRDLVTLWGSFNTHVARVMSAVPAEARLKPHHRHNLDVLAFNPVPATEPATLDYFMADYVWHVHHHLKQIPFLGWQD